MSAHDGPICDQYLDLHCLCRRPMVKALLMKNVFIIKYTNNIVIKAVHGNSEHIKQHKLESRFNWDFLTAL